MRASPPERCLDLPYDVRELCARLRPDGHPTVLLEGAAGEAAGWRCALAFEPRLLLSWRRGQPGANPLERLDRWVLARRKVGGPAETGIVALLGFDFLPRGRPARPGQVVLPDLLLLGVDASIRFAPDEAPRLVFRGLEGDGRAEGMRDRLLRAVEANEPPQSRRGALGGAPAATSLPRSAYLSRVERVKRYIRDGEIYQANLIQRFATAFHGDPLELYCQVSGAVPAPRAALVEAEGVAMVSASPEVFLRVDREGWIETHPIKGTRPRGATPTQDRRLAEGLLRSAKDRAELLMIVDLERNDLGRVCETGSVHVPELAVLQSYPAVHHLVARVRGRLRPGTPPSELLRATFPGGSVSGAPKLRALEILRELEPVDRQFSMGALLWFGDDGSLESSILIRTLVLHGGMAYLGAGGGVVADSDPVQEWSESNHKARPLAAALGFDPEEAT